MKKLQLFLFILLFSININAQVIYVSDLDDKLYRLDINTCEYDYLVTVNSEVFDITFHPNGNLYGISGSGRFYEIDTVTGATSQVHKFSGQYYNSLTAAGDGLIYTTGTHMELWSYDITNDIAKYHGDTGFKATGDLTFYDGKLYAATTGNRIVLVDIDTPSNSSIVISQTVPGDIFGIVSYTEDCLEVNSYAITNGDSDIYQIDFTTNSLNFICELAIEIGGGASTFEFLASSPLIVQNPILTLPLCNIHNGSIEIEATGGNGEISYSINGSDFYMDGVFENLEGGIYSIYIQDDMGCIVTEEVDLNALNSPEIMNLETTVPTCGNINGNITIMANGGTGQLEYSIDGINFQIGNVFSNLGEGSFNIVVKDSLGCLAYSLEELEAAEIPSLNLVQQNHTTCNQIDGFIEVGVGGGVSPFAFTIDGDNFQTSNNFENLASGNYTVMVQDDLGCADSILISIESSAPPLALSISTIPTTCGESNGSIIIATIGDDEMAQYAIDGITYQDNNTFLDIPGGEYDISVRDNRGCLSIENAVVADSEVFALAKIETKSTDCGETNGSILIDISGGTAPINVILNNEQFPSDFFYENLEPGIYSLTLQDEIGCELDTLIVVRTQACPVYVPNIFSPNNDKVNDVFTIYPHPDFIGKFKSFRVYDRWGTLLYNLKDFNLEDINWDGTFNNKEVESGVYIYHLEYMPQEGEIVVRKGDVTIVK